jgi:hypothetical protein
MYNLHTKKKKYIYLFHKTKTSYILKKGNISVVDKAHGSRVVTDAERTEVRTSRPGPVEH